MLLKIILKFYSLRESNYPYKSLSVICLTQKYIWFLETHNTRLIAYITKIIVWLRFQSLKVPLTQNWLETTPHINHPAWHERLSDHGLCGSVLKARMQSAATSSSAPGQHLLRAFRYINLFLRAVSFFWATPYFALCAASVIPLHNIVHTSMWHTQLSRRLKWKLLRDRKRVAALRCASAGGYKLLHFNALDS